MTKQYYAFRPYCIIVTAGNANALLPRLSSRHPETLDKNTICCGDPLIITDGKSWTVFDGYAVDERGNFIHPDEASFPENEALENAKSKWRGSFTLCRGASGEATFEHDVLGMSQLYYVSLPTSVLITNSPGLAVGIAADLGCRLLLRQESAISIIFHGASIINDGPYERMRCIPVDQSLTVRVAHEMLVFEEITNSHFHDLFKAQDYPAARSAFIEDVVANIQAFSKRFGSSSIVSDLSGGRDSRIVLAGLLAAGLEKDAVFSTRYGDHPDTTVAQDLATIYGLELSTSSPIENGSYAEMMDATAAHVAGLRAAGGAWLPPLKRGACAILTGACGELSRVFYPARVTDDLVAHAALLARPLTLGEVAKPAAVERLKNSVASEMNRFSALPADLRTQIFYLSHRNRYHFGLQARLVSREATLLAPLYSKHLISLIAAQSPEQRVTTFAVHDIINSLRPDLLQHRFAEIAIPKAVAEWIGLSNIPPPVKRGDAPDVAKLPFTFSSRLPPKRNIVAWASQREAYARRAVNLLQTQNNLSDFIDLGALHRLASSATHVDTIASHAFPSALVMAS